MKRIFKSIAEKLWTGTKTVFAVILYPFVIPALYFGFSYGDKHGWFDGTD